MKRTQVGLEVEAALGEVLAHVRGEVDLPCRIVDDPAAEHILALRKRMKLSRREFADRFGLDARAVQECGAPCSRPRRPCPADRHRPRPRGGRACAQRVSEEDYEYNYFQ